MKKLMLSKLSVAAMVVLVFLTLGSNFAHADLEIALQEDAGAVTVVATGPSFTTASFTGNFGDFTVTLFGASSDNGASLSDLLESTVSVKNNSAATHTLHLYVTQNGYTLPSGTTLRVESGLGGSVNAGSVTLTNIFQAYADKNNNLFGTADFTNGPQNASQVGSTFDTGSATGNFTRLATPYSVTSVANLQLTAGGQVNKADHINLTAVPEPTSVLLLGSGLVGLAAMARRRSRKQ
jgi:hypothetical protein